MEKKTEKGAKSQNLPKSGLARVWGPSQLETSGGHKNRLIGTNTLTTFVK